MAAPTRKGQIMLSLAGKTVLVTGASRGIGRAAALALAKRGAQVLVHSSSGATEAEAVVHKIRNLGGRTQAIAADLSRPDAPHSLAALVRAIVGNRLDIPVASAGISKSAAIEDTSVGVRSTPWSSICGSTRGPWHPRQCDCPRCRRDRYVRASPNWKQAGVYPRHAGAAAALPGACQMKAAYPFNQEQ
jgi:hypothetical protein